VGGPAGHPAPAAVDDTVARPTDSGCRRGVSAPAGRGDGPGTPPGPRGDARRAAGPASWRTLAG